MKAETLLVAAIREAVNKSGRARLLRNNVGFDLERKVRYGLAQGSPDLCGVLRGGRAFCIEVKTAKGRVSAEQTAFWMAARRWGVLGGVARSVTDAMRLLDEAEAAR